MANLKEIKKHNEPNFLKDVKRATEMMVFASSTREFFTVKKGDVMKLAETQMIEYCMTDSIYKVGRMVMVIT